MLWLRFVKANIMLAVSNLGRTPSGERQMAVNALKLKRETIKGAGTSEFATAKLKF